MRATVLFSLASRTTRTPLRLSLSLTKKSPITHQEVPNSAPSRAEINKRPQSHKSASSKAIYKYTSNVISNIRGTERWTTILCCIDCTVYTAYTVCLLQVACVFHIFFRGEGWNAAAAAAVHSEASRVIRVKSFCD